MTHDHVPDSPNSAASKSPKVIHVVGASASATAFIAAALQEARRAKSVDVLSDAPIDGDDVPDFEVKAVRLRNAFEQAGDDGDDQAFFAAREALINHYDTDSVARAGLVLDGTHPGIAYSDVIDDLGLDDSFVWTPELFAPYVDAYRKEQVQASLNDGLASDSVSSDR